MSVYMIFYQDEISDPAGLQAYQAKAGPTLAAYKPIPRVVTTTVETIEGDWKPVRVVMLEFETKEQALGWYNSPEYTEVRKLRLAATKGAGILVEGFPPAG
jgi:uncharacterized protein (DUF1330 family)